MELILKIKDQEYTLPQENLIPFAQYQAMQEGIIITDTFSASKYLESKGFQIEVLV